MPRHGQVWRQGLKAQVCVGTRSISWAGPKAEGTKDSAGTLGWGRGRWQSAATATPQKNPVSHSSPALSGVRARAQSQACCCTMRAPAKNVNTGPKRTPRAAAERERARARASVRTQGLPRPAPPMPRPFCCFCCCRPPRPRPLATTSSLTMSMISSGMRRYLMVLPRI